MVAAACENGARVAVEEKTQELATAEADHVPASEAYANAETRRTDAVAAVEAATAELSALALVQEEAV